MGRGQTAGMIAIGALGAGCLDFVGHEEIVTQHSDPQGMMRLEDDRIEDKHPAFDPARMVTESFGQQFGSCEITMNKSAAVTKLDIVPFEASEAALKERLFRGRTEALAAVTAIADTDAIPSMEVVNGALKPFNDGLYAAVEIQVEDGKRRLLAALAARLGGLLGSAATGARPAIEDAAVLVGTAQKLGGDPVTVEVRLQSRVDAAADAFTRDAARARPIGFYTWTPELGRIFTRDRFLQNGDDGQSFGAFAALAWVLGQEPALLADYQRVTVLYAGLTNPYQSYTVDDLIPWVASVAALADPGAIGDAFAATHPPRKACDGVLVAFLPSSRSKEVDYFDTQFCAGIPAGTNLLDALIEAVSSGAVDLTPADDSGWYDYQLHALETMLLPERGPESQHLLLTAGYKKKLIETFKSLLIQNRETHVKQLGVARATSLEVPPVDVYPLLPVEPFPTYYLRTARGYRFLQAFLSLTLGAEFFGGTQRLEETGQRGAFALRDELEQRIQLLYGLHFASADAIGMARDEALLAGEMADIHAETATATARAWLGGWKSDADVVRDPRVIVPISYAGGYTTYWAVVGVKALVARAEFVAGHEPQVTPTYCWSEKLVPHRYTLLVEETAELRLPSSRPPPTRAELRAICDAHATRDAIIQAFGSQ